MTFKQIIILVILAVLVGGSATYLIKNQTLQHPSDSLVAINPTSVPTVIPMLTWTDPAGFSFQYPSGTQINNHPEDTKNYANLTLSFPDANTSDIIMTDNTFKDLSAWVGQKSAIDTTLDGKPAKKIITSGIMTVAAIDNEVLVTITGKNISAITDSWTFIYPTPTVGTKKPAPAASNDSGDVLEEE